MGIPLCLVVVSSLGRKLFEALERLCIRASACRDQKWLPLLTYILLGNVLFIWVAAAIFGYIENWAYIDAVYYTFITLSTIGFGDFIPGKRSTTYQHRSATWCYAGPLFTKRTYVFLQDLAKSRNREIVCHNDHIARKFDRHIGNAAADAPFKFQSDWKSLNPNLASSRFYEISR